MAGFHVLPWWRLGRRLGRKPGRHGAPSGTRIRLRGRVGGVPHGAIAPVPRACLGMLYGDEMGRGQCSVAQLPGRLAVVGVSSGGNLAAAIALMARDRGGPRLAHQTLVAPVIQRDFDTGSYFEKADGPGLTRKRMQWYWDLYLRDDSDASNPYAAPGIADSLAGLAPTLVLTAEHDGLQHEGRLYAQRLRRSGVPVIHKGYAGMTHLFFNRWNSIDRAVEAIAFVCAELKARLLRP